MNGCLASFGMNTSHSMPGGRRIRRGGVAGVPSRRQGHGVRAERPGAGDRGRQAARLERVGRIERFVLDEQPLEPERRAQTLRVHQRREALAERDRLFAGQQRHQLAIPPHVRRAARRATRASTRAPPQVVAGKHRQLARRAEEVDARADRTARRRNRSRTRDARSSYLPSSSWSFFCWRSSIVLMWRR